MNTLTGIIILNSGGIWVSNGIISTIMLILVIFSVAFGYIWGYIKKENEIKK